MSLIPRSSLFDLDNVFENFFAPSRQKDGERGFFSPRIDLKETKDKYHISAELPGVKKEDIHITLKNGILTIQAESKDEHQEEKDGKVIRQERRYGKFMRSFNVGSGVQEKDISASFADGILELDAPRLDASNETGRRIPIN